ncbi:MAG: aminodeoxychorismate/anthranilate synthase component II [Pseudomonadota bacterium]
MSAPHLLVIDNYDSFTWNLVHYLHDCGATTDVVRNDQIEAKDAFARMPTGIVLSPGPCTPTEAGICVELIREAPDDLPILGVCLGHQSIAQALGGRIRTAQEIRHGKVSEIHHTGGPLFAGLPERYTVVRYHSLSIQAEDLPNTLVADAFTDDGEIMAIRHVERPVFGVQFHPESIKTEHGHALLTNWLAQIKP